MTILLLTPQSCAGFLGDSFSGWFPCLALWLFPVGFSACGISLPCVLRLLLFWLSLGFSHSILLCSLLYDSVESQLLRDGVLPPGRVSSVGIFIASFPWFPFLSPSLGVFLVCSDLSPCFSHCVGYYLLRRVFLAVYTLLFVGGWLSRLHFVCFYSSF